MIIFPKSPHKRVSDDSHGTIEEEEAAAATATTAAQEEKREIENPN